MVCKNWGIYGFLGPSWVLITLADRGGWSRCPSCTAAGRGHASRVSPSTVVVFNVLQGTGLITIENTFPVRDELKNRGGKFWREGCGQMLKKNVWIIRTRWCYYNIILLKWLVCLRVEFGSWITKQIWVKTDNSIFFWFGETKLIGLLMQSDNANSDVIKSDLRIGWPKSDFGPKSEDSADRIIKSNHVIGL